MSTTGSTRQARDWVERQLRFQRLMEELRTRPPASPQNGACPPPAD
jgi:hypothetical protein